MQALVSTYSIYLCKSSGSSRLLYYYYKTSAPASIHSRAKNQCFVTQNLF